MNWQKISPGLVTKIAIFVAFARSGILLYVAMLTQSTGLEAAALDSLVDGLVSALVLVAIVFAHRPADEDHRFGHGKAEALMAYSQSWMLLLAAAYIFYEGYQAYQNPLPLERVEWGVMALLITITLTAALAWMQTQVAKAYNSKALTGDALHYISDVATQGAVMLGLLFNDVIFWPLDAVVAMLVSLWIMKSAWTLGFSAAQELLDQEVSGKVKQKIIQIANQDERVKGINDVRIIRSGSQLLVQLHMMLDDRMSLLEAHKLADDAESRIRQKYPHADVIIHQEPNSTTQHQWFD